QQKQKTTTTKLCLCVRLHTCKVLSGAPVVLLVLHCSLQRMPPPLCVGQPIKQRYQGAQQHRQVDACVLCLIAVIGVVRQQQGGRDGRSIRAKECAVCVRVREGIVQKEQ